MTEKRIDVVVRTGNSKQAVDSLDSSMKGLGASADKVTDNLQDTALAADRMKPAARGVQTALSGMGRTAGAASIQIQQFVGQIQGGQSAMLALSQQGADLGIVMGAPLIGAIVGVGASIVGMAFSSYETQSALERLADISEQLGKTMQQSAGGVDVLGDKILALAEKSNALAKLEISKGIQLAEEQIERSAGEIKSVLQDATNVSKNFYDSLYGSQGVGQTGGTALAYAIVRDTVDAISKEYDVGKELAEEFATAVSLVKTEATPTNIRALENALTAMNQATGGSNEKVVQLASDLGEYLEINRQGVENVNNLRIAYSDLSAAIKKADEELNSVGKTVDDNSDAMKSRAEGFANAIVASQFSAIEKVENQMDTLKGLFDKGLLSEQSYNEARMALALTVEEMMEQQEARKRERLNRELEEERRVAQAKLEVEERRIKRTNDLLQQAAKATEQSYQQSGQLVLSTLMSLAGGSEKAAKAIKIAQGGMAAYMVYSNYQAASAAMLAPPPLGLGPIAGAGPAATLATAGKIQAALTLAGATASAFSGSSVSAPSVSQPSESLIGTGAQQPPQQAPSQRFVDIRADKGALFTLDTVSEIINNVISNDEDVTINITAQQNNLRRTGAI